MFEEDLESELNPKKIGEFGKWILTNDNLMLPDVSIHFIVVLEMPRPEMSEYDLLVFSDYS